MNRVWGVLVLTTAVCLTHVALGAAQAAQPAAQLPAEKVFKNIQVLKGVPVDEFLGSMGFISNALAVNCTYCHLGEGGGGWDEYAKDNPKKLMARTMIVMVNTINKTHFGGRRVVTCVTCHNGANVPATVRELDAVYRTPTTDEPDAITRQAPGSPSADQVLDKYIAAVGGPDRLAKLVSWTAKGTYIGYGDAATVPLEIYARAPGQMTRIIRTLNGLSTTVYDGRSGWSAVPEEETPIPLRVLTRGELDGVRLDAQFAFPGGVKQFLTGWQGSLPAVLGDDKDLYVIQGNSPSGLPVKLYFDAESGLLVRQIRYTEAFLGRNMTQIDYDDYREVAGVKLPFKWTLAWQSGQGHYELTDVQPNVAVDASRFAAPAAPAPALPAR
jgi:photosynthetic reaction center cytochrome c subunit